MERRQVLLVDAFADEPTGGRSVAIVPDGTVTESQRRAIASELGTSGVVTEDAGGLVYTDCDGSAAIVSAAVAGYTAFSNRGLIEPSTHEFVVSGPENSPGGPFVSELLADGTVSVELPRVEPTPVSIDDEEIADALGIDVATLQDVGADLPAAKTARFGGTLLVPINFLEHLSSADPSAGTLEPLLDTVDASELFAFTFDTLERHTDVHARIFDPRAAGGERPASGVGAGACAAHLGEAAVFDGERDEITIECGRFIDRPGTVRTTVGQSPVVGGNALTVLDAELAVPTDSEDSDIIEL